MFNSRLKSIREEKRITQMELAKMTGIAQSNISGYESKGVSMTEENIVKLCKALKITSDYLLGLVDKPETKN